MLDPDQEYYVAMKADWSRMFCCCSSNNVSSSQGKLGAAITSDHIAHVVSPSLLAFVLSSTCIDPGHSHSIYIINFEHCVKNL